MKDDILEPKSPSTHHERKNHQKRSSCREKKHTRSSGLHLRDILLPQPKLFIDSKHILSNRQRGHSIRVMRHTSDSLCALSGCERLPPSLGPTTASMYYRKVNVQRGMLLQWKNLRAAQSIISAVPSFSQHKVSHNPRTPKTLDHIPSGPKNKSSGLPYKSTRGSLM